ncbi:MAG: hypothetical protein IKP49_02700 [Treponema sp.]|nr:hypothetical protein [Treponema sp.]
MRKIVFSILLFLVFAVCHADDSLDSVLNKMREINCYMGSAVYESAEKPEQYSLYEIVRDSCTKAELEKLLRDKNGVVRSYALQALVERNEKLDWDKIALGSLSDTESIETMFGCIVFTERVGDIFLDMIENLISQEAKDKIDIQLLETQSPLLHAYKLLHSDKKSQGFYELTRKWALAGNENAIFSLAKYQKKEDYPLVLSLNNKERKYLFFKACPYILNDSLKPFFAEYMDSILPSKYFYNEWKEFYKSLAMFKDDFSKKELRKVFSSRTNRNIRKYHLGFIAEALETYTDGFYDDILFEMWEKYHVVKLDSAKNLLEHDKKRALDCMVSALKNSDEYIHGSGILSFCIENLLDENYDVGKIFVKELPELSGFGFNEFFEQIKRFEDDSVDKALLKRLRKEKNGYVAIPIYDYLLSKKNPSFNKNVLEIYNKNKSRYMDWVEKDARKTLEKWNLL